MVYRDGGQVTCWANYCPHQGYMFDRDTLQDGILTCPVHGWAFRIDTGEGLNSGTSLYKFPFRIRDGRVEVQLKK